jgi:hypothetical protein
MVFFKVDNRMSSACSGTAWTAQQNKGTWEAAAALTHG